MSRSVSRSMSRLRHVLPALLLTAVLPGSGWAEMTQAERETFRGEVRAYLLENPELLNEMIALLETRQLETTAEVDRDRIAASGEALYNDGFSFVGGNPEGSVTIVEFLDYQCGYCRRAHPEVAAMIAEDGDIRWIVKEMPILGPESERAARAAIATLIAHGPEAYAAFNDRLMRLEGPVSATSVEATLAGIGVDAAAVKAEMDGPEVSRRLEATLALARELEIMGTPTFVFGDRMLRGYAPVEAMQALVAEVRAAD